MVERPTDADRAVATYRRRADAQARVVGGGPPVLFSHGTLMDRTMFDPQLDALGDAYRCIAYNSRARTDQYADPYDLDDLADDCAAVMDCFDVDSATVVGMSMGGFMGLRFALRYPGRLDALVLVDSMAEPHPEGEREQFRDMLDGLQERGHVTETLAEASKHLLFGQTTIEESDLGDRWVARWMTYPPDAIENEVESWRTRPGVVDRLDEIDVPVLVVHGAEDASISVDQTDSLLEGLPDARREVVPAAGHSSNLERPGPVTDAIRPFLDDVYG